NILIARPAPGYGERILLTDFGIGRLHDDSRALTKTGSLVATLAYAAPEQLEGAQIAPATDQYSLACALFWLLCGSTPFAATNQAAVIAGHLHHPPPRVSDRRRVPTALNEVLIRALAKQPGDRFGSCGEFAEAARLALDSEMTPFETKAIPLDTDATLVASPWRPETPAPQAVPNIPPPDRSRRHFGRWLAGGAVGLVVVLAVVFGIIWATANSGSSGSSSSGGGGRASSNAGSRLAALFTGSEPIGWIDAQGKLVTQGASRYPAAVDPARCGAQALAVVGPLSGPNAPLGRNVLDGVRLMVGQFTKQSPNCPIAVKEFDTTADPAAAAQIAPRIADDPSVLAVIGPVFSGELKATGKIFDTAGVPFLTPSASNPTLSTLGFHGFFRGLPTDELQGPAVGRYLAGAAGYRRVCVLADNSEYGAGLANGVTGGLGPMAVPSCSVTIPVGSDPADAVNKIVAAAPDAVYYAGYYTEAGPLVQRLRKAGITAPFVSGDGSYDPEFVTAAGSDASGALVSCPCGPVTEQFLADYAALNGQAAGVYSPEAYDLTAIVLRGIAAGHTSRADLLAYLKTYTGEGIARTYAWTAAGELTEPRVWLYKLQ
ncbi:ABC transporter substrate-binding protein, partial [Nocardia sp. JMUB6875]|uniref:ABC transporter substrate-binding protein n=1 Tax=Nocardia sp. JMUB6875 TaxID=3158170 RepID=UPI0034E8E790